MAKPLSEHRENVKSRKVDTFEPVEGGHLEPVNGGHVRRVVFAGREPTPSHFEPVEDDDRERVYHPRHQAPIEDIEREIDNLGRGHRAGAPKAVHEETVYSTEKGHEVRAATFRFGRKAERVLYTTEDRGGYQEERRFNNADVDKVIAGVELEPEVEVIKETKTEVVKRKRKITKKVPVEPKPKAKPAKKAAAKPKKATKAKLPYDYKGDVHEVVDLEGIGPTYEKKLHAAKITNTQELLFTDDAKLEKLTGAPAKTIQNWKDMSQLVKINGVGPQFAELMVRAGIAGIEGLKKGEPKAMVAQVKEYEAGLKTNVTGSGIGIKRMTAWHEDAKKMRKVPIDLAKVEVIGLESREARKAAGLDPKGSPFMDPKPTEVHCAAYTKAGDACKNAPRTGSKYCTRHKGYRAPSKAQLAANAKA